MTGNYRHRGQRRSGDLKSRRQKCSRKHCAVICEETEVVVSEERKRRRGRWWEAWKKFLEGWNSARCGWLKTESMHCCYDNSQKYNNQWQMMTWWYVISFYICFYLLTAKLLSKNGGSDMFFLLKTLVLLPLFSLLKFSFPSPSKHHISPLRFLSATTLTFAQNCDIST